MKLGKNFTKEFLKVYSEHRWPHAEKTINSSGPRIWTEEMLKILDEVGEGMKLECKKEETHRIDRVYCRRGIDRPIVAVKHENTGKGNWESQIRRLLAVNARLRVLIYYSPHNEHLAVQRRIKEKLNAAMQAGHFNDEFLLILGKEEVYPQDRRAFSTYWYFPVIVEKKL